MAHTSTADLIQLLKEETSDSAPSNATSTRYLKLLDRAHKAIVAGGSELNTDSRDNPLVRPHIFSWALSKDPIVFNLEPKTDTTISVVNLNNTGTLAINSSTKDFTNYHIRINNDNQVYRIVSHSGTAITLDSQYIEETGNNLSCEVFKLIYEVGTDILVPTDRLRVMGKDGSYYPIEMVNQNAVANAYPLARVREQRPRLAGVLKDNDGSLSLQMNSYPHDYMRVELRYVPTPTTLESGVTNPILPERYRIILVHLAAFYQLRKRDDDRAMSHLKSAKELFQAMKTSDAQITGGNTANFGRVMIDYDFDPIDPEFDTEDYI